jgi:ubiquinone/menaquinone biosynthesis C-methylase UbiE
MAIDPEEYRAESRDRWERSAEGWGEVSERWDRATRPVSDWLVQAIGPQPGQTVLELAAGPGDVGLLVAELLRPGGRLIATDGAGAMVTRIGERAAERGLTDVVETRPMEAEWIDLPAASVDAVVCRWGYMLLADPGAALRETRRVLRSGGRVALAAWDAPERNLWSSAVHAELVERELVPAPDPAAPGQFAWRERAVIGEHLEDAGFAEVVLDTVEFAYAYPGLDAWWDTQIDLSLALREALLRLDPAARDELMEAAQARLAEHVGDDGSVVVPAATHVARAEA